MTRYIDLSVPIQTGTSLPPPAKRETRISQYTRGGKEHWQGSYIETTTHVGSHVDSPLHVVAGAPTIGQVPLEKTIGEAVLLDLTPVQPNEPIGAERLEPHRGKIREGDIAVLRTDWTDRMWNTPEFWTESPYLTEDGARWLAEHRPKAVVVDFFEEYIARFVDFQAEEFVVHLVLLRDHDIAIVENATNLGALSRERFRLFAAPMKIMDSEGGPTRIFAMED
jgi:arylformamidase